MTLELWNTAELFDAIQKLKERSERDEALRAELGAQLENIYALADPSFRNYFGVLDAAVAAIKARGRWEAASASILAG